MGNLIGTVGWRAVVIFEYAGVSSRRLLKQAVNSTPVFSLDFLTLMKTWGQEIFLSLSLLTPCTPKLHSGVYVLESSESKGSHSSFSYAIKQTPFSVNVQPIGRLVVWKFWSRKAPAMGLTLMGNPPTLPCPSLLYQSALWALLIGHSTGIDELTLTNVLYELANAPVCHSSLLNCLQSVADLTFLCQAFPLRMKEDRTK